MKNNNVFSMGCYNNNNRKVNSRKIWQFENFFFFIWPKSDLKLPISDGVITLPPLPHPPIHTLFTELNGILSPTEPEYRRIESRRTDQRNLEPGLGDIISPKHGTIGIYSYPPTFNMELLEYNPILLPLTWNYWNIILPSYL